MAPASKWKLNKTEEKMVNDEAGQVFQKHIDEGKSKAEATKLKDEFLKERSTELKQAKADRNELKKKQGKDAPAPGVASNGGSTPKGTKESPTKIPIQVAGNNSNYFQEVQKAMAVVLNHPAFNKIEKESPLPITGDMAKESGCQARFKDFKFQSHILFCFMHIIHLF